MKSPRAYWWLGIIRMIYKAYQPFVFSDFAEHPLQEDFLKASSHHATGSRFKLLTSKTTTHQDNVPQALSRRLKRGAGVLPSRILNVYTTFIVPLACAIANTL